MFALRTVRIPGMKETYVVSEIFKTLISVVRQDNDKTYPLPADMGAFEVL
jgi:hypothetical protein